MPVTHLGTLYLTVSRTLILLCKPSNAILRLSFFLHTSTFSAFEVSYKNALYKSTVIIIILLLLVGRSAPYYEYVSRRYCCLPSFFPIVDTCRISAVSRQSSPYCGDIWRKYCCLTNFFPIVHTCLSCEDIARQNCAMVRRW